MPLGGFLLFYIIKCVMLSGLFYKVYCTFSLSTMTQIVSVRIDIALIIFKVCILVVCTFMHIPFLLVTPGESGDQSVYAIDLKNLKLKNWNKINFFPDKNYIGLFYCPCTKQHDLCIIHCTLHINLSKIFARYKIPVYNFNSYIKFENCNLYHISDSSQYRSI